MGWLSLVPLVSGVCVPPGPRFSLTEGAAHWLSPVKAVRFCFKCFEVVTQPVVTCF